MPSGTQLLFRDCARAVTCSHTVSVWCHLSIAHLRLRLKLRAAELAERHVMPNRILAALNQPEFVRSRTCYDISSILSGIPLRTYVLEFSRYRASKFVHRRNGMRSSACYLC